MDLISFKEIHVSEPDVKEKVIRSKITLDNKKYFDLIFSYQEKIDEIENIKNIARLMVVMPLINYGLFTENIYLDFPLSENDLSYIKDNMDIISRDIFVNKICKRRADFIKKEYIPKEDEMIPENAKTKAKIHIKGISDYKFNSKMDKRKCTILSSGGKESLLTYGLLNEMGFEVYPIFFNESGGHWRTALPAYKELSRVDNKTKKVWSNIDRFYLFMLDNLKIIRKDHRKIKSDTYPIRLFIFGPYIFSMLPLIVKYGIGNILLGSEYDDPRANYYFNGIKHYFGIYDQSVDFDVYNTSYFKSINLEIRQWSIVRPITGLIVERILTRRYPELYRLQRSCHSCHFENGEIVPCGTCTKCLGVMSFIIANDADPRVVNYKENHIKNLENNLKKTTLRLDPDEREHTFYLLKQRGFNIDGKEHEHVEMLHFDERNSPIDHIEGEFKKVFLIYRNYVKGAVKLVDNEFVPFDLPIN